MTARRVDRSAFTLIELLVVMAIISILIGLLLPAVQKVREAAARVKCQNNLKQLALALHNYEGDHGYIQGSIHVAETGRLGFVLFLLPYIEQDPLYKQFDFTKGWNEGAPNRALMTNRVAILICPSSPDPGRQDGPPDDPSWAPFAACMDYATIYGVDERLVATGLIDNVKDFDGMMPGDKRSKFSDVSDGLSNTLLFVESAGKPQIWRSGKPFGTPPQNRVNGGGWARPASDFELKGSSRDGSIIPGPCAINCTNGDDSQGKYPHPIYGTLGTGETYAFHTAGSCAALGDGSVRLITADINIRTFARLVTRNGGEVNGNID
jgi:prepilin-type N-terminal cleavage/methylation domain-containing protein